MPSFCTSASFSLKPSKNLAKQLPSQDVHALQDFLNALPTLAQRPLGPPANPEDHKRAHRSFVEGLLSARQHLAHLSDERGSVPSALQGFSALVMVNFSRKTSLQGLRGDAVSRCPGQGAISATRMMHESTYGPRARVYSETPQLLEIRISTDLFLAPHSSKLGSDDIGPCQNPGTIRYRQR